MRKLKIAILLLVQVMLSVVLVLYSVKEQPTKLSQIDKELGLLQSELQAKESRLRNLYLTKVQHPTSITIVETSKDKKSTGWHDGLNMLSREDAEFLTDVANGRK